jgi:hypothetical protein
MTGKYKDFSFVSWSSLLYIMVPWRGQNRRSVCEHGCVPEDGWDTRILPFFSLSMSICYLLFGASRFLLRILVFLCFNLYNFFLSWLIYTLYTLYQLMIITDSIPLVCWTWLLHFNLSLSKFDRCVWASRSPSNVVVCEWKGISLLSWLDFFFFFFFNIYLEIVCV